MLFFSENVGQHFQEKCCKIFDERFQKYVESNVFSRKMLIEIFSEKCWFEKCWFNIFFEKMLKHFLKNCNTLKFQDFRMILGGIIK
jgi:hypothetical protein